MPKVGSVMPEWPSVEAATGEGLVEYHLAPGDVVDISVFGHADMRQELPVRPDGKISYLLVGDLPAVGLTVEALREDLEGRLKQSMRYPKVTVVLKSAREARFTILGAVTRPGSYPVKGPTTLIDAIAQAQGLSSGQYEGSTIEIADLDNAFLVRRGKVVPVDFELAVRRGDSRHNVLLEDGDYVHIPSSLAQEVYVLGEVFNPRAYGFRGRVSVLEAVAQSGGFRPTARLSDVVVLRGLGGGPKELVPLDVKQVLKGEQPDLDLEVGDVVYVPRGRLATAADTMRDILSLLLVYQSVDNFSDQ